LAKQPPTRQAEHQLNYLPRRSTTHNSGWRILGRRMADGSMPLGDYEAVDLEVARIDYLPVPNVAEIGDYCIPSDAGGIKSHQLGL